MAGSARGKVVVLSGPSGAGKTTVLRRVLQQAPVPLVLSVSATTRAPRPGEVDGRDYHFLAPDQFHRLRREGGFIECFQVFGKDHWYGTLASEVTPSLEAGKWVLLEIDVQGAQAVMDRYPDAITIFLRPSSWEELQRRLRGRGTESEEAIGQRLARARHELAMADRYQYVVINDKVDDAVRQICQILAQHAEVNTHDRRVVGRRNHQ
ncbi:MAG TPA: guanylate kinase [Planctomycetaceae bacterium]|nr:guanylate kinase [Planctomycetaceae bacterium]HIQ21906.1 guanylate kinase [Planctomycetota bacterium]